MLAKRLLISTGIFALLGFSAIQACAADITAVADETGKVDIVGKVEERRANQEILIFVLAPNSAEGNLIFDAAGHTVVKSDGSFTYTYNVKPENGGEYTVRAGQMFDGEALETSFVYFSQDFKDSIFDTIADYEQKEDVISIVANNLLLFGLKDFEPFESLSDKDLVYTQILEGNYDNLDELILLCQRTAIMQKMNESSSSVTSLLNDYADVLDLSNNSETYEIYSALPDQGASVRSSLGVASSYENFIIEFDKITVLSYFNQLEYWSGVRSVVNAHNDGIIEIPTETMDIYNNVLIDKAAVDKAIYKLKGSFTTLGVLKDRFISEVNRQYNLESTPPSTPNYGGGGGGSVGTVSYSAEVSNDFVEKLDEVISQIEETVFDDLEEAIWAKESIMKLYELKVISKSPDKLFRPTDSITKEEYIKMIVEAFSLSGSGDSDVFADVPPNEWYFKYVSCAYENGIVLGKPNGTFGTGEALQRQDAAVLSYRTALKCGVVFSDEKSSVNFKDDHEIADYAKTAIDQMQSAGIINGVGDNMFAPNDYITRAQAAKIIAALISNGR